MSRLTKYNRQGKAIYDSRAYVINENPFDAIFEKLAHYEDLEEQGRLIELPCKVGDTVWKISTEQDNYDEPPYKIVAPIIFRIDCLNAMGENIFTTKEEAEAKLAELRGDKHDA
jgi:hypothetical protein